MFCDSAQKRFSEWCVQRGIERQVGQALFSGVATVNLGDGTPTLSGVPFSVIISGETLRLSILSTNLPAAQLTSGVISIE